MKSVLITALLCSAAMGHAQSPGKSVSIGVDYILSGPGSQWGLWGRRGLELAAEELNQNGGISGKPVRLIFEDSGYSAANSVTIYRKLSSVDRVSAVIGNIWSFLTNPILPILDQSKVLLVSPTLGEASAAIKSPYLYSMGPGEQKLQNAISKFFDMHPTVKKIGIIGWDDAYGHICMESWKEVARKHQVAIAVETVQGDWRADYRTETLRMKSAGVDAIFVGVMGGVVKQRMRELQFDVPVFTTSGIEIELDNSATENSLLEGIYYATWVPSKEFTDAFKKKFGMPPRLVAHQSYEALRAVAKALEKNPRNPSEGMKSVKYEGVSGLIDFSSSHFGHQSEGKLVKIVKGESVVQE